MNRKSAANKLSNKQIQVLITGRFGDGCLFLNKNEYNFRYSTSSIDIEMVRYKKELLGELSNNISTIINKGFKLGIIYTLKTKHSDLITKIATINPLNLLHKIDDLGLALWLYDDGSLHKSKLFYNINTQKYSKEDNEKIAEILYNKFKINAIPTIEKKKDGRIFWYLRVRKFEGAFIISEIMRKNLPSSLHRKCISSETILIWSKLQEKLKSSGVETNLYELKNVLTNMLIHKIEYEKISIQDIVPTLVEKLRAYRESL